MYVHGDDKENVPPFKRVNKEPNESISQKNASIIDQLIYIDHECNFRVPVDRPIGDLVHLFDEPPANLDFDSVSDIQTGARLEEITVQPSWYDLETQSAQCKFAAEPRMHANYQMDHHAERKELTLQESYNGMLPRWIRVGNPDKWLHDTKGVPTAKVMKLLMFQKLGLSKENTSTAISCAMNAQTVVDVLHSMIVQGKSVEEAFAGSQTVQLLTEIGQMLGYNTTKLTTIRADTAGAYTHIPTALTYSSWSQEQIEMFSKQPKVRELIKAGVPIIDPNFRVPDAIDIEVKFED